MNRKMLRQEALRRWAALDSKPDRDEDEDELLAEYDAIIDRLDSGEFDAQDPDPPPVAPATAGATRFDAMSANGAEVAAVTSALLNGPVMVGGGPLRFSARPQRTSLAPSVEAHVASIEARRNAAEERAAAVETGALDARTADPAKMRARLRDLGLDAHLGSMFREPPARRPSPEKAGADAAALRRRAHADAERKARTMLRSGEPIDVRKLSRIEYDALLRARRIERASVFAARGIASDECM